MSNPVLCEVMRGGYVESRHRGSVAVVDADGRQVLAIGDIERPIFPRSAVKSIQALPLVESGAADAFGFGDKELALACASHSGEPEHVELARSMLERAGLGPEALECGTHWPSGQKAMVELARSGGAPSALCNNCSGKHAGFLCACVHEEVGHRGYVAAGHPLQDLVREALASVTGHVLGAENRAIDGCSIPTYAIPLHNLALGFARMATGQRFSDVRAKAAKRLFAACMAEPFYVAGTGRACTRLLSVAPGRVFVKTGAEGVYCGAIPELGLGIALKCDDGAGRAAETMIAAVLANLLTADAEVSAAFAAVAAHKLTNWNGVEVGALRPAGLLV